MKLLTNKTVLITGASKGIGAETAILFAQNGANVVANYFSKADNNNPEAITETVNTIKQNNGEVIAIDADITDKSEVDDMVKTAEKKYGPISILITNAFIPFVDKPIIDISWEEFEYKLVAELKASFYITKAVLPEMIKAKNGSIVAVSSGLSRQATYNFSSYTTSKSALNGFIKSLAFELGSSGIRANVIAPGFTKTPANQHVSTQNKEYIESISPLKKLASPNDIAKSILFLASDLSSHITGAYLPVDGGITML